MGDPDVWSLAADLIDPPRPGDIDDEFSPARRDPEVFIDRYCWVIPAAGGTPVPFHLWDFQRTVLADLRNPDLRNIVILKARQLGLSWLCLAYGLWLTNCNPGQTFLILNRRLGAALELLDRVRFMFDGRGMRGHHQGLPEGLRAEVVRDTNDQTAPMLAFANGSRIISLPSGEDTGSGLTAQYILGDELAKWQYASETLTAINAVLAGGGTFAGVSTAKGTANEFARMWRRAQPGAENPNGFWPIFIPSSAHPGRDDEWLERTSRTYPDLRKFRQEHPEKWQDAFQLADDAVFSEFDRSTHHRPFVREPQWPVWRGIDFGFHHSPCYWIEVQGNRVAHVYAELDARQCTTVELAGQIVARDRELGLVSGEIPAGVDPAGKARTSQSGTETDHLTLVQAGIHQLHTIEPSVPSDRVDQIKRLLRDGRLVVDCAACPRLAEALEQAQWATTRAPTGERIRTETYAKDGVHEHYLDAVGYALANIWPPAGAPAGSRGPTPPPTRTTRYGTSEFD